MRTTSSLEANNGVMNNCVVNHGNFFTFVHDLRLQEFLSAMRFDRHFQSGGKEKLPRFEYKVLIIFLGIFFDHFFQNYHVLSTSCLLFAFFFPSNAMTKLNAF